MADRRRTPICRPWHSRAPENPQCPTTVHAEGSQIVWLTQREEDLSRAANPLLAQHRGDSASPITGEQERVRTG